jgi:UDP:flavonoid glycosyltransferase YjiC (YdhE family)
VSRPLRILIGAVGWTGHAFPAFALTRALTVLGHEVTVETFEPWRETVEGLGARFEPATERMRFDGVADDPAAPALATVARELAPRLEGLDAVVTDLWTLAPALAAELAGVPRASLIPHPYPVHEPGLPFYTLGLQPPRTAIGRAAWRAAWPLVGTRLPNTRLRAVRASIDGVRDELGLAPLRDYDGQVSDRLAIVATFPQLEYPRRWPASTHVVGPLPFETDAPDVEEPPGTGPLVLVASSTERDPEGRLIATALEALADGPVRVLAATNRRGEQWRAPVPANARVVDWLSYGRVMPRCAAVNCHGGHGTVARALGAGVPVLVCPEAGDMAENGARASWAGAGLMLRARRHRPRSVRRAIRRLLGDPAYRATASDVAAWGRAHDGPAAAADLVEGMATGEQG